MPNSVVDSSRDEHKWKRAEQIAAKSGHKADYAYIMGIYKRMKPDHQFKTASLREHNWLVAAGSILSHSSWDSEVATESYANELEKIAEGLEKTASRRSAEKIVKNVLRAAEQGGAYKGPRYTRDQVSRAFGRRGEPGQRQLVEMGSMAENRAMKGAFSEAQMATLERKLSRDTASQLGRRRASLYERSGGKKGLLPEARTRIAVSKTRTPDSVRGRGYALTPSEQRRLLQNRPGRVVTRDAQNRKVIDMVEGQPGYWQPPGKTQVSPDAGKAFKDETKRIQREGAERARGGASTSAEGAAAAEEGAKSTRERASALGTKLRERMGEGFGQLKAKGEGAWSRFKSMRAKHTADAAAKRDAQDLGRKVDKATDVAGKPKQIAQGKRRATDTPEFRAYENTQRAAGVPEGQIMSEVQFAQAAERKAKSTAQQARVKAGKPVASKEEATRHFSTPEQAADRLAKGYKPTGRGMAPAAETGAMERMARRRDFLAGRKGAGGWEHRRKIDHVGPEMNAAQASAKAKRALKAEEKLLAKMKADPIGSYGAEAITAQTQKVTQSQAALSTARSELKSAMQKARTQAAGRAAQKEQQVAQRAQGAVGTERLKLKGELARDTVTPEQAKRRLYDAQVKAQRAQTKPPVVNQQPAMSTPGQPTVGQKIEGNMAPRQGEMAAGQAGGFWEGLKNTWGSMPTYQKGLLGAGAVGAGAFMAGRGTGQQQPQPGFVQAQQPMYRPPPQRAPMQAMGQMPGYPQFR